jgi:hypothetical protein
MQSDPTPLPTPLMQAWIDKNLQISERLTGLEAKIEALMPLLILLEKPTGPSKMDRLIENLEKIIQELSEMRSTQRQLSERLATVDTGSVQSLTDLTKALTRSVENLRRARDQADLTSESLVKDAQAIVSASTDTIRRRLDARSWLTVGVWSLGAIQTALLVILVLQTPLPPSWRPLQSGQPSAAGIVPPPSQRPSTEPPATANGPLPTPTVDSLPPLAPSSPPAPGVSSQVYVATGSDTWTSIRRKFPSATIQPPDGFTERPKNRAGDPIVRSGDQFTILQPAPAGQ